MKNVVLLTVDSVRYDFVDHMKYISSLGVVKGTSVGHYTRPSLASIVSGQLVSAAQKRVSSPTLSEQLSAAGYTCIGLAPSPQTDPVFNFDAGFDQFKNFYDAGNRGKKFRDYLAQFNILRRIYHRVAPPHAKFDQVPKDQDVLDEAVERFNDAESPCFLWIHLNEPHRPYGHDSDAIPKSLDRKALFSPDRLTDAEHNEITSKYRQAIKRTDSAIKRFHSRLDEDTLLVFTSDHGDEFGEEGKYFHQPQRRRTVDALTDVPVAFNGIELANDDPWISLLDIAPTILSAVGLDIPEKWDGIDHTDPDASRDHAITIAPWLDKATVSYKTRQLQLTASDSYVSLQSGSESVSVQASDVPREVEDKLRNLGYVG